MSRKLMLGYSPCPNDTFIFQGLASGRVEWPGGLDVTLADVEELNGRATEGTLDVVKVSVGAVVGILDNYILLRAGGAMGFGVGPLLVSGEDRSLESLDGCEVAIPGRRTTASLLFSLCCREAGISVRLREMVFDQIMPAVAAGKVAAGVVIHEGRFTYEKLGLTRVADLGEWWETYSGSPVPLGGIAIRRTLGMDTAQAMNAAIRRSLELARSNPGAAWDYIKQHAQEMDDSVIRRHIETFVTDYSLDVGEVGEQGVERLLREAGWTGSEVFIPR
ncbi:1,4-dihydroxy-6-naphthoate synthase [Pseudodesulfovibrio sp.]|uniref:1,4-dihydroxy-6-naphthoate synthase n=1 Tax=unclassified Pseudodesulfovibrio TaxID=2661612 RepID=UPI003AFFE272